MSITIENDIPMPARVSRGSKYPFGAMNIGSSFFVANVKASSLASASRAFAKQNPDYKFTVRGVDGGSRVWRVTKEA